MKKTTEPIPVIADVDLLVLGGSVAGAAAARAAAKAGKRVMLAAPETYLGEGLVATGRLWRRQAAGEPFLPAWLLPEALQRDARVAIRPLEIKRRLDEVLIEAGVQVLLGCAPADLLADADGAAAGAVLAFRSGAFAVRAGAVIDATEYARGARAAGIPFTRRGGDALTFRQVVTGRGEAEMTDGHRLPLVAMEGKENEENALRRDLIEYEISRPLPDWNMAELARAWQAVRDATWRPDQAWRSDWPDCLPPVRIDSGTLPVEAEDAPSTDAWATSRPNFFVLGPCANLSEAAAERMLRPDSAARAGESLVEQRILPLRRPSRRRNPVPLHGAGPDMREPCTCDRFRRNAIHTLRRDDTAPSHPVLGEYDVVVVGGGTGGAPAALAAGRAGARVLLIESLSMLGGVGTAGYIAHYYHGNRAGFTAEVTEGLRKLSENSEFHPDGWNPEHKAEWFRRELRAAGVDLWFGTLVSGALAQDRRLRGVIVNTPLGRGIVRADVVVDATGNADVAAAAGALCRRVSETDLAIQGAGLPFRPFLPEYRNTDYLFIEDADPVDVTRAFTTARRKFRQAFDLAQIPDTRERRQIVGDVTVTPPDVYAGRTWSDVICLSRSNFDSHGFTVHPMFVVLHPDRTSLDAWLPLRALLPRGFDGLLVTGLGLSAQRDVMPVLRMQPDVQNHAYAAGLAAAAAARHSGGNLRAIDIKSLQRELVRRGILPQTALLHTDRLGVTSRSVRDIARGPLQFHSEIAAVFLKPAIAVPLVRERLDASRHEEAPETALRRARLLAMLGDRSGEELLLRHVTENDWGEGWNYTGMGQFGRSLGPVDETILALAHLHSEAARSPLLEKARRLSPEHAFSHFRALAVFVEALRAGEFAPELTRLLHHPDIAGNAWERITDPLRNIPESTVDTTTRNRSLRELYLARALFKAGDPEGVAADILRHYAADIRGHYAIHAARVLAGRV